MPCKNCGHDKRFHGKKLNSPYNPWDYEDGECYAFPDAGKGRRVRKNESKAEALVQYAVDRAKRTKGTWPGRQSKASIKAMMGSEMVGFMRGSRMVCGCKTYEEDLECASKSSQESEA